MGQIIELPPPRQPRADAPASGAQILLFTGVWRERYETAPVGWSAAKSQVGAKAAVGKRAAKASRDNPKGPTAPTRGKKRA